jgi:hypothetical protein
MEQSVTIKYLKTCSLYIQTLKIKNVKFEQIFFFIMYSRKVQVKYIADTRLQGRNQEKHMVIWH